jgi:hypothetical protein
MHFPLSNGDSLVLTRDCRKIEMCPAALPQQVTGKIIVMQALHYGNDGAILLVIEA